MFVTSSGCLWIFLQHVVITSTRQSAATALSGDPSTVPEADYSSQGHVLLQLQKWKSLGDASSFASVRWQDGGPAAATLIQSVKLPGSTTHQIGNTTWQLASEFALHRVPRGIIMQSGLVVSPDKTAYRFGHWFWNNSDVDVQRAVRHALDDNDDGCTNCPEYMSFIQPWQEFFQHIIFDTLPKASMSCSFLTEHKHVQFIVKSRLQSALVREVCPGLQQKRFKLLAWKMWWQGSAVYVPQFHPALELGLYNRGVMKPLGRAAYQKQKTRIVYMARPKGKRFVENERKVLKALRQTGAQVTVLMGLKNYEEDRALFTGVDYFVGPHGGALSNMLFLPPGATVVEFGPMGYWRLKLGTKSDKPNREEQIPRPCFMGLTLSLGLRYVALSPKNVDKFSYDRPMRMDVQALRQFFAGEKLAV